MTVVDTRERAILFTENTADNCFCDQCPNRCRLLSTLLYGCNEARRWHGRYAFYCPIGLTLFAVTVPETGCILVAGPMVMGELQDIQLDLPDYIRPEQIQSLKSYTASDVSHMTSLLEMAVYGLCSRPDTTAYDRNLPPDEKDVSEITEVHSSVSFMSDLEEELETAVKEQEKSRARAILNQLLRYVYTPRPDQVTLIKSRAAQLVLLLPQFALMSGSDTKEAAIYRTVYLPRIKDAPSLEEMDEALAEVLHHFVDYTFDFTEVKHSDTIYRIMEYVKSNYSRKITLEELAAYVYLSPSHISSLFRKETGQTISAYINHVRIEKSKFLLRQAGIPLADIAVLCGFEDQSYFTRVFKKYTGISPRQYRNNAIGDKRH